MESEDTDPGIDPYAQEEFWRRYAEYVEESLPRHKRAVQMLLGGVIDRGGEQLAGHWLPNRVLDLGCGRTLEGERVMRATSYIGVDRAYNIQNPRGLTVIALDYRFDLAELKALLEARKYEPTTLLSLFSIEPTDAWVANEDLYARLLETFPSAQRIISAGFYYEGMESKVIVKEAGGLESYQLVPGTPLISANGLVETRLAMPAPSRLFGSEVIEVWRLIERR